jgi:hypothetical protein
VGSSVVPVVVVVASLVTAAAWSTAPAAGSIDAPPASVIVI